MTSGWSEKRVTEAERNRLRKTRGVIGMEGHAVGILIELYGTL